MNLHTEEIVKLREEIEYANERLRYYKQQEKITQSEIRRLTRRERTHRLCTRGGMVESFIKKPELLTDEQVMELLTLAFRQSKVSERLQEMLRDAEDATLTFG